MVESKLTESTNEVQNVDSGQTVALAALIVRAVSDELLTNNNVCPEKTAMGVLNHSCQQNYTA